MAVETRSELEVRTAKLQELRDLGINPFSQTRQPTHHIADLQDLDQANFPDSAQLIQSGAENLYSIAGRLMLQRVSGKLSFGQIKDETGTIQIMIEHEHSSLAFGGFLPKVTQEHIEARHRFLGESSKSFDYLVFSKMVDVGDIVGVSGELTFTKAGELTLFVSEFQLLSKAIRPLGDKFHGLGDDDGERAYRQRYLDMIFNNESLQRMKLKSTFIKTLREFYWSEGFIEIETPILGNFASGAAAKPFVTHHEDFDVEMYLRIAPEIALKMATVGGLEKVFEIGKNFRNEGSSPSHHQEFLVVEHYGVYWTYEDNMRFTEKMFNYIFDHIPELSRTISIPDKSGALQEVTFGETRERIDYTLRVSQDSGIDIIKYGPEDEKELREAIKAAGHTREGIDKQTTATMIDYLYKKVTRPSILGPAFVYNYPASMQPLARRSDDNPEIVEQFQAVINGREINKAYSELVDPLLQQSNFDEQSGAVKRGDHEATKSDTDFVRSMEYGMPPQSGYGMGLDRVFALLTEQSNIRDVIMFPMIKKQS